MAQSDFCAAMADALNTAQLGTIDAKADFNCLGMNLAGRIECQEQIGLRLQVLKPVHPIGHTQTILDAIAPFQIVPA